MCIYMPAPFIIVNAMKEFLKRKKVSRGVNRTLTIITSFAVSFGLMGLITFGTLSASNHGLFRDKNEETYEHRGMTFVRIPAIYTMCRERLRYEREELWENQFDWEPTAEQMKIAGEKLSF